MAPARVRRASASSTTCSTCWPGTAGSNHTLPTDGAARFASGLSARHFRRRMAEVRIGAAAPALARAGIPIARAEGFPRHAASMEIRDNSRP